MHNLDAVEMRTQGRKVAVVGAGPAGLAAARHFTAPDSPFECIVFEQGDDLGGTWRLSEYVGADPLGRPVHSSMYNNLRYILKNIYCDDIVLYYHGQFCPYKKNVPLRSRSYRLIANISYYKDNLSLPQSHFELALNLNIRRFNSVQLEVIRAAPCNNQIEINIRDQKTRTSVDLVKIFLHFFCSQNTFGFKDLRKPN